MFCIIHSVNSHLSCFGPGLLVPAHATHASQFFVEVSPHQYGGAQLSPVRYVIVSIHLDLTAHANDFHSHVPKPVKTENVKTLQPLLKSPSDIPVRNSSISKALV